MVCSKQKMLRLAVFVISLIGISTGTPLLKKEKSPLDVAGLGLQFLGSTPSKELYITTSRKSSFQYALGFGCSFVFENDDLALASIESPEEVAILNRYFGKTQSIDEPPEPVWTSGIDRLGHIRQWASTGKHIDHYPSLMQGDWSPGQGHSPTVADYNCIAIWRYCDRQGHGAIIPSCNAAHYATWFTPRPCKEERRYICERSI